MFVLSPDFVRSKECTWEVETAARLGKRLVPVLHRSLEGASPQPALGVINFVDASGPGTLIETLIKLGKTLKTDLGWLKQSTRLLNLAQDWEAAGRPENRLLFAADVEGAVRQVAQGSAGVSLDDAEEERLPPQTKPAAPKPKLAAASISTARKTIHARTPTLER